MIPLTKKENKSYHTQKFCKIYAKEILVLMIKIIIKSEIIVIILENIEVLLIIFVT